MTPRFATAAVFFVNGAGVGSLLPQVPYLRDQLDISKGVIGLCLLAMTLGALIAMPIAGQLLDRRPSRAIVRGAIAVYPLVLAFPLLARTPVVLAAVLFVVGAANGFLDISMNAHGAAIERDEGRPIMSSLHAGWSLGGVAGAAAVGLSAGAGVDPRVHMVVTALVLWVLGMIAARSIGHADVVAEQQVAGLRLPPRDVVLLGVLCVLVMVTEGAMNDWSALYLREDLGTSAGVAASGFAAFSAGMAVGRFGGDAIVARFGAERVLRGGAALAALVGGVLGDRTGRHHPVATAGYGTSAVARALLAVGGTAGATVGGAVLLDRLGKGIRTAPRDAMISLSTPEAELGTAFGVHRAMDTTGALLGPLVAFALLAAAPGAYGTVWLVSLCAALLGVGVIALLVRPPAVAAPAAPAKVRALTREVLRDARVRRLAVVAALLGLTATSDAFVYLALRDRAGVGVATFPLLFLGTALVYMALAVPAGRLADRVGRARVLLGGSALMVAVDALLLAGGGPPTIVLALALLGAGYAATDGVLAALASGVLPEGVRGTGLSVVGTASSAARLLGSVLFGTAWTAFGLTAALEGFAIAVLLALAGSAVLLRGGRPGAEAARA